jgi:hypothetical protein
LAEKYVKAVQKVINKGTVYLRLNNSIYRVKKIEIRGADAKFECKNLRDGEDYEISFKIEKQLMVDIIRFGLNDQPNSIFIISEDLNKPVWFETSLTELIEEAERQGLKRELEKELASYENLEED